jgi:hypothetical protein
VGASLVVILLIRFEQVTKMPLAKYNNMIQAIPPDRADQAFCISVPTRIEFSKEKTLRT